MKNELNVECDIEHFTPRAHHISLDCWQIVDICGRLIHPSDGFKSKPHSSKHYYRIFYRWKIIFNLHMLNCLYTAASSYAPIAAVHLPAAEACPPYLMDTDSRWAHATIDESSQQCQVCRPMARRYANAEVTFLRIGIWYITAGGHEFGIGIAWRHAFRGLTCSRHVLRHVTMAPGCRSRPQSDGCPDHFGIRCPSVCTLNCRTTFDE